MTFGSLFAGIGGFDLGFERAGMECKWQVEIDDYATRVLEKHWPNVHRERDVRDCGKHNLERVDVICGGDPCQANSAAFTHGKRADSLGGQFVRIVGELRPRVVVRENPSQVNPDAPWPWWRMRRALREIGYSVLPFRFRACCFGADHRRDRLFLLAELPNAAGVDEQSRNSLVQSKEWRPQVEPRRFPWMAPFRARERRNTWVECQPGMDRVANGVPDRTHRLKGLGNAVVPQIAEWIGKHILEAETAN